MFVIGTAGHVDHGKSTLIEALTGIHPDRLREEQEREMTIDLGFAWVTLPSGREVSIVDVPGHEDFIKNMLAGVGGIDVALFVVAADEGAMPQTREHLAILDLLEVSHAVVALTKIDLVPGLAGGGSGDDGAAAQEWLELVQEELREELADTVLADAPIVPVSALTGEGLDRLLQQLDRVLDQAVPRRDVGRPRLPIDRIFSIAGFGTIVTGTLLDGHLNVGDEVQIVPGGQRARVRGLQTHKVKVTQAEPGTRVAINLSGVAVDELVRGQVVALPGTLDASTLVDARLRTLSSSPWPLQHNALVDFYSGSARVQGHVRLLDTSSLEPGQEGWVQIRLAEPVALARGDGYILRLASPSMTLGGGRIVQTQPGRRYKRFQADVLERLAALGSGDPSQVLLRTLEGRGVLRARDLVSRSGLGAEEALGVLEDLVQTGQVISLAGGMPSRAELSAGHTPLTTPVFWDDLVARVTALLSEYHGAHPLRVGMPREELGSRLSLERALAGQILERALVEKVVAGDAQRVWLPAHTVVLSAQQQRQVQAVLDAFAQASANAGVSGSGLGLPPTLKQVEEEIGAELLQVLLEDGRLIKLSDDVLVEADIHERMRQRLVAFLRDEGSATVAQVRDVLGTSRRYALSFLEDMDRRRVTKRMGDLRILRDSQVEDA
ncbi:MAG: selenocysteine-specific translation elongation factor [Anaerolineae bacterium]|nr:selenocysteine-specific translation elongation factor [Anaerolineae bacterium]